MRGLDRSAVPTLSRWSTADVPPSQRFEYFSEALSSALIPMRADSEVRECTEANIVSADFDDGLTVIRQNGSAHWSYRDRYELQRSGARTFHLIANYRSDWFISHAGQLRLAPGDAVLTDSAIGHRLEMHQSYDVVHVKLSDAWLQRWLPKPSLLVGRLIPAQAGWGRALTSFMAQLSPACLMDAPLPSRVIADQLGALLSIVGGTLGGQPSPGRAASALRTQIHDRIHQYCAEPWLSADAIAARLNIGAAELHRCLANHGESFGALLQSTRARIAARMLQSRSFGGLTMMEIAHRSGFESVAQLGAALRTHERRAVASIRSTKC